MAIHRVPWSVHQGLSCSVRQAPGGWSVSLWMAGLPDYSTDQEPDADLEWMTAWTLPDSTIQTPISLDGLTIQQTTTGWTFWTAGAWSGNDGACLMVEMPALTCYSRTVLSRSDAVLLSSRLRQTWWPVLYSVRDEWQIHRFRNGQAGYLPADRTATPSGHITGRINIHPDHPDNPGLTIHWTGWTDF